MQHQHAIKTRNSSTLNMLFLAPRARLALSLFLFRPTRNTSLLQLRAMHMKSTCNQSPINVQSIYTHYAFNMKSLAAGPSNLQCHSAPAARGLRRDRERAAAAPAAAVGRFNRQLPRGAGYSA